MNYACAGQSLSAGAQPELSKAVAQGLSSDPDKDVAASTCNGASHHHPDSD